MINFLVFVEEKS